MIKHKKLQFNGSSLWASVETQPWFILYNRATKVPLQVLGDTVRNAGAQIEPRYRMTLEQARAEASRLGPMAESHLSAFEKYASELPVTHHRRSAYIEQIGASRDLIGTGADLYGIGVVTDRSQGLFLVDLDDCVNGQGPNEAARAILKTFPGAYTELSQSGEGVHILGYSDPSKLPFEPANKSGGWKEFYNDSRYCALTFDTLPGAGPVWIDHTANVSRFVSTHMPVKTSSSSGSQAAPDWPEGALHSDPRLTTAEEVKAFLKRAKPSGQELVDAANGNRYRRGSAKLGRPRRAIAPYSLYSFENLEGILDKFGNDENDSNEHRIDISDVLYDLSKLLMSQTGYNARLVQEVLSESPLREALEAEKPGQWDHKSTYTLGRILRNAPAPPPSLNTDTDTDTRVAPPPLLDRFFVDEHEFDTLDHNSKPFLVDGLIPSRGAVFLTGQPKLGKSWVALDLALAVSRGIPFLERSSIRGNVLYLAGEGNASAIQTRLRMLRCGRGGVPPAKNFHIGSGPAIQLDEAEGLKLIKSEIIRTRAVLAILDPLTRLHSKNENDRNEVEPMLTALRNIVEDTGCTLVMVHHPRKESKGERNDPLRGSSAFRGFHDALLWLKEVGSTGKCLTGELRDAETPNPIYFNLHIPIDVESPSAKLVVGEQTRTMEDDARRYRIIQLLRVYSELSQTEIREHLGGRAGTWRKHIKSMVEDGVLDQSEGLSKDGIRKRTVYTLHRTEDTD